MQSHHHTVGVSRRHMECHVGMRPGNRYALHFRGCAPHPLFCPVSLLPIRRRMGSRLYLSSSGSHRSPSRRIGGTYPRTHRARSRWHVVLSPTIPSGSQAAMRTIQPAAHFRRNRHRIRPHRETVRLGTCGSHPRHHVHRQSPDRRIHDYGGHFDDTRSRPHNFQRKSGSIHARAHLHG